MARTISSMVLELLDCEYYSRHFYDTRDIELHITRLGYHYENKKLESVLKRMVDQGRIMTITKPENGVPYFASTKVIAEREKLK